MASKGIVAFNGIIDPGFCGVVKVLLFNFTNELYRVEKATRFAQIIFSKNELVSFQVNVLDSQSKRNNKGFGSSGVN